MSSLSLSYHHFSRRQNILKHHVTKGRVYTVLMIPFLNNFCTSFVHTITNPAQWMAPPSHRRMKSPGTSFAKLNWVYVCATFNEVRLSLAGSGSGQVSYGQMSWGRTWDHVQNYPMVVGFIAITQELFFTPPWYFWAFSKRCAHAAYLVRLCKYASGRAHTGTHARAHTHTNPMTPFLNMAPACCGRYCEALGVWASSS